jgi:CBS domain containing-hemolysin-like protein
VDLLIETGGFLIAMAALLCCSAFFSCSEAALFYLRRQDRRGFLSGNPAQRAAARLLENPDRLLTAVLFWNLMVNVGYFTLSSVVSLRFEQGGRHAEAGGFALGSLLAIILLGEMLPKSLAVLHARFLAATVSIPLSAAVRALDPVAWVLQAVNLLSRRLIWPAFKPEPYMHLGDLERAIELSTSDAALLGQEQTVLGNIVSLSDIRVDELMRPRTQFLAFRPPVALDDLQGQMPPSGYLLLTEKESDDVAAAIPLKYLSDIPAHQLEHHAVPVVYVPWCATAAAALEEMRLRDRKVAAVVNEFGETIGILTFDDLLATIFADSPSRSARLLRTSPIAQAQPGIWHVTGMTSLRRLARDFQVELPETHNVTVAGVTQEVLQRLPARGDEVAWGPFRWTVLDAPERGQLTVELTLRQEVPE